MSAFTQQSAGRLVATFLILIFGCGSFVHSSNSSSGDSVPKCVKITDDNRKCLDGKKRSCYRTNPQVAAKYLQCEGTSEYTELSGADGELVIEPIEVRLVGVRSLNMKITASDCVNFCVMHERNVSGIVVANHRRRNQSFECHCGTHVVVSSLRKDFRRQYVSLFAKNENPCRFSAYCPVHFSQCEENLFGPDPSMISLIPNPATKVIRFCPIRNLLNYCHEFGGWPKQNIPGMNGGQLEIERSMTNAESMHQDCIERRDPDQDYLCSLKLGWRRSMTERWYRTSFRIRFPLYATILTSPIVLALNVCLLLVLHRQVALGRPAYLHQMSLVFSDIVTFALGLIFLFFDILMGWHNNEAMCQNKIWRILGYLHIPIGVGALISNQLLVTAVSIVRFRSFRNPVAYQTMNHRRTALITNGLCYPLGLIVGFILFPQQSDSYSAKSYRFRDAACAGNPNLTPFRRSNTPMTAAYSVPLYIPRAWVHSILTKERSGCRLQQTFEQINQFALIYVGICLSLIIVTSLVLIQYNLFRRTSMAVHPREDADEEEDDWEEVVEEEQISQTNASANRPKEAIQMTTASRIQVLKKREKRPTTAAEAKKRRRKRRWANKRNEMNSVGGNSGDNLAVPGVLSTVPRAALRPGTTTKEAWKEEEEEEDDSSSSDGSSNSSSNSFSVEERSESRVMASVDENYISGDSSGDDRRRGPTVSRTKTKSNKQLQQQQQPEMNNSQQHDSVADHEFLMTLVTVLEAVLHLTQTVTVSLTMMCHKATPGQIKCITVELLMYFIIIGQVCIACPIYLWMSPNMRKQALAVLARMTHCQFKENKDEITINDEESGANRRY